MKFTLVIFNWQAFSRKTGDVIAILSKGQSPGRKAVLCGRFSYVEIDAPDRPSIEYLLRRKIDTEKEPDGGNIYLDKSNFWVSDPQFLSKDYMEPTPILLTDTISKDGN